MRDLPLNNFVYKDEEYDFAFANQNEAFHPSLIVRPKNLKVLRNETDKTTAQLKVLIVEEWFQEENEKIKLAVKEKKRLNQNKEKGCILD